jgi:hypothetical protein
MATDKQGWLVASCPRMASRVNRTTRERVVLKDDDGQPYPCEGSVRAAFRSYGPSWGYDGGDPGAFEADEWGSCSDCGAEDWTQAERDQFDADHSEQDDRD